MEVLVISVDRRAAYNKGIAASMAGRCYLRLQFTISFGLGRTNIAELLFVIFCFITLFSSGWGQT